MLDFVRRPVVVALLAGAVACSKSAPAPTASEVTAAPTSTSTGGDGKLAPDDARHGTRRLTGLDAPIFVDGVQVGVLRAGEMPAMKPITLEGGGVRYRIYDYLKGLGVAIDSIESIHLHGNGDRIASIEGTELRKEKDRFVFSFLNGNDGTAVQRWDTDHLKNPFVIHEIRRVTVYAKKPVPAIHPKRQCHVDADGKCTDAIPYNDGAVAKGTRVYLDGKMVGFVKRRQITDAMILGASDDSNETRYSLARLVGSMGVDLATAKSVELMAGDDVIARASGAKLAAIESSFTLPKHNHGKVRVHVPVELQADRPGVIERDALVSAVLVYKSTAPAQPRALVPISEDTDLSVQLASIDVGGGQPGRGER